MGFHAVTVVGVGMMTGLAFALCRFHQPRNNHFCFLDILVAGDHVAQDAAQTSALFPG